MTVRTAPRLVATVLGLGRLRPAPGTWASAAAIAAGIGIDRIGGFPLLALATAIAIVAGFWACFRFVPPGTDPSEVVIDEVAGQWITLLFPVAAFWNMGLTNWAVVAYPGWVASFLFFRLFDIWKPWLIGRADRRGDAVGVMLDDLIAGVFAGIAVIIAAGISHGVLMR